MLSITVAFPLSAGRMLRFSLFFMVFIAALSVLFRLYLGRGGFFKILTICLASSAFSIGKDDIAFSTPVRMSSMGVDCGVTAKLRPFCNSEDTVLSSISLLRLITVSFLFSFLVIGCCFLWIRMNFLICLALLSSPACMALFRVSCSNWDQSVAESFLAMRRCVFRSSLELLSSSCLVCCILSRTKAQLMG